VNAPARVRQIRLAWYPLIGAVADLDVFLISFLFLGGAHGPIGPMVVLHYINAPMSKLLRRLVPIERSTNSLDLVLAFSAVILNGALYGLVVALGVASWRALSRRRSTP